jgi:hypothetical protein
MGFTSIDLMMRSVSYPKRNRGLTSPARQGMSFVKEFSPRVRRSGKFFGIELGAGVQGWDNTHAESARTMRCLIKMRGRFEFRADPDRYPRRLLPVRRC